MRILLAFGLNLFLLRWHFNVQCDQGLSFGSVLEEEVDIVYCVVGEPLPSSSIASDCSRCCEILTVKLQAYFAVNTCAFKKYSLANTSILFNMEEFFHPNQN